MPLSEHEKHELEEIEHALATDNPQLASSFRTAKAHHRWLDRIGRLLIDLSLLPMALALLIIGVHVNSDVGTTLGVIGYALFVLSIHAALTVVRQRRRHPGHTHRAA